MGRQLRRLPTYQVNEDCYIIETQVDKKTEVHVFRTRSLAVREWNKFIDRALDLKKKFWIRATKVENGITNFINEYGEYQW